MIFSDHRNSVHPPIKETVMVCSLACDPSHVAERKGVALSTIGWIPVRYQANPIEPEVGDYFNYGQHRVWVHQLLNIPTNHPTVTSSTPQSPT